MTPAEQSATTIPAPAAIKQCSKCGAVYTQAEWNRLDVVGQMNDGHGGVREFRNCGYRDCHSTISIPVTS